MNSATGEPSALSKSVHVGFKGSKGSMGRDTGGSGMNAGVDATGQ